MQAPHTTHHEVADDTNPWTALSASQKSAWVLLVVGTEHRVGASVTSLALAEAAATHGLETALVDGALPRWSGLRAALEIEGPRVRPGVAVCKGRHGGVPVYSRTDNVSSVSPAELLADASSCELVVVDAGATLAGASAWASVISAWLPVAAVTHPGLARAEAALEECAEEMVLPPAGLAGIGTSLDPGSVAGFRLAKAVERQWAPMPRHAGVEVSGTTPGLLPAPIISAATVALRGLLPTSLAARVPAPSQRGFRRRNR